MSASLSPTPPVIETTPKPAIVVTQTPLDMVNVALTDPDVEAVFNKYFGNSKHGPIVTLIATGVTAVAAHEGLQLPDPVLWGISGLVGLVAGYAWNWFAKKYLTPATPTTH